MVRVPIYERNASYRVNRKVECYSIPLNSLFSFLRSLVYFFCYRIGPGGHYYYWLHVSFICSSSRSTSSSWLSPSSSIILQGCGLSRQRMTAVASCSLSQASSLTSAYLPFLNITTFS